MTATCRAIICDIQAKARSLPASKGAGNDGGVGPVVELAVAVVLPSLVEVVAPDAQPRQAFNVATEQLPFMAATHFGLGALAKQQRHILHAAAQQRPLPIDDRHPMVFRRGAVQQVLHAEVAVGQGDGRPVKERL